MALTKEEVQNWFTRVQRKNGYCTLSKDDKAMFEILVQKFNEPIRTVQGLTEKTSALVRKWNDSQKRLARLQEEVEVAKLAEASHAKDLANWIIPKDAKLTEVFHLWYGDNLLEIRDHKIKFRVKGTNPL